LLLVTVGVPVLVPEFVEVIDAVKVAVLEGVTLDVPELVCVDEIVDE